MDDFLIDILMLLIAEEDKTSRRKHLLYLRDTANPFEIDETIFSQFFRLPKVLANRIIRELEAHNEETSDIPFSFRVLSTLHFLGHGSYQKCVAANYLVPMSQPSVSRNIAYVCKLMATKMAYQIKFCGEQHEKNVIKEGFYTKFGIKGVIGAIDCSHVAIVAPATHDPNRPARLYMNRKGFHSINVESIVDSNLKFLSVNAKYPGSVHDSAIWTTTPARIHLLQQHDSRMYNWLIGDSGYLLEPWLLTPFPQPPTMQQQKFNDIHIRARNTVERAFGVLKSRFRCLHKNRTLHYTPNKAAFIIYTCSILHNMLVDCGFSDELEEAIDYDEEDIELDATVTTANSYLTEGRRIRNEYANTL